MVPARPPSAKPAACTCRASVESMRLAWVWALALGLAASREARAEWKLEFSSYLGGTRAEAAFAVAFAPSGEVVVAGFTRSPDFPTTVNAFQPEKGPGPEAFVSKLDPSTGTLIASTYLGGSNSEEGANDVAVDRDGNVYVVGFTCGTGFPVRNAIQSEPPNAGSCSGFLSKLSPGLDELLFSTYLGGTEGGAILNAVALDQEGTVWVAWAANSGFPMQDPLQATNRGQADAVVARIDAVHGHLLFSTYWGGSTDDYAVALAYGRSGSVWVSGHFGGSAAGGQFPLVNPIRPIEGSPHRAGFVLKLEEFGRAVRTSSYLPDWSTAVAVNRRGAAYLLIEHPDKLEAFADMNEACRFRSAFLKVDRRAVERTRRCIGAERVEDLTVDRLGRVVTIEQDDGYPELQPTTGDAVQAEPATGVNDLYLAAFTRRPYSLRFGTYLGGSSWEDPLAVAVSRDGRRIAVVGRTYSADLPLEKPVQDANPTGRATAFVSTFRR